MAPCLRPRNRRIAETSAPNKDNSELSLERRFLNHCIRYVFRQLSPTGIITFSQVNSECRSWVTLARSQEKEELFIECSKLALDRGYTTHLETSSSGSERTFAGKYEVWYHGESGRISWRGPDRDGELLLRTAETEGCIVEYLLLNLSGDLYIRYFFVEGEEEERLGCHESMYRLPTGCRLWHHHIQDKCWGTRPLALGKHSLYRLCQVPPSAHEQNLPIGNAIETLSLEKGNRVYLTTFESHLDEPDSAAQDEYELLRLEDGTELLICLPNRRNAQWTGFKIVDGATGVFIQQFTDDLMWDSVAVWPWKNGFLVWSKIMPATAGKHIMIRYSFLLQDRTFHMADVSMICHEAEKFHVDPYTHYGLVLSDQVKTFSLVEVPPKEWIETPIDGLKLNKQYRNAITSNVRHKPMKRRKLFKIFKRDARTLHVVSSKAALWRLSTGRDHYTLNFRPPEHFFSCQCSR